MAYGSVGLSHCLSVGEHISRITGLNAAKFNVRVAYGRGRGSVLPRRRYDASCASRLVDHVMFLYTVPKERQQLFELSRH